MKRLLDTIARRAQRLHLEQAEQVTEVSQQIFAERMPFLAKFISAESAELAGRPAKITGFDMRLEAQAEKPPAGVSLRWREGKVIATLWTSGGRVKSVEDALDTAAILLSGVLSDSLGVEEQQVTKPAGANG
jgi:hypothetical protein